MSIAVIIQQMIMIFILIIVGGVLYKTKILSEAASKEISGIIINVTNPAMLITSALESAEKLAPDQIGIAFIAFGGMYVLLFLLAYLLIPILKIEKQDRYAYKLMFIFANVGFMGIPIASAVIGPESLIFVSICNLLFSIIIYTYGISIIRKAAIEQKTQADVPKGKMFLKMINAGTIAAVVTIIFYLMDISLPNIVTETLSYAGRCTTFLSMIVLGVSVVKMKPKEIFGKPRMYLFVLIRLIIVPLIVIFVAKRFISSELMVNTILVMASVPMGNMPLMFSKQYGLREDDISTGIILSTVLSLLTIPVVSMIAKII